MRVAVGSENPVKVAATERALPDAVAEPIEVASGVPEQPRGREQTITGARNRAEAALAAIDADLGVGIEGGVARIEGADGLFLIMWAAVTDGERGGVGGGPSLRLPEAVAARVAAGDELGPVMDDLLDTEGVAEREGAAGVLTGERIDRESALVHAVASAAGPFVAGHY
jgi:inosine/xanthosine triphosphatase